MLNSDHSKGRLFLIKSGKPNHNANIESFNGCFRDECLNEHWLISMAHVREIVETQRREYNEERHKKSLSWADSTLMHRTDSKPVKLRSGIPSQCTGAEWASSKSSSGGRGGGSSKSGEAILQKRDGHKSCDRARHTHSRCLRFTRISKQLVNINCKNPIKKS